MTRVWAAVLLVGAGSYLMRLLPLLLVGRLAVPDRVALALRDAGTAAIASLLVGSVTAVGRSPDTAGPVVLAVALSVASVLAVTGRAVVLVVLGGAAAYASGAVVTVLLTSS